jgi:hypothetical protein
MPLDHFHVRALVVNWPEEAIKLIAKAYIAKDIATRVRVLCELHGKDYEEVISHITNGDEVCDLSPLRSPTAAGLANNASPRLPPNNQGLPFGIPHQNFSLPPSPSLTSSTNKSISAEYIIILVSGVAHTVSMKSGFTHYSFIGEDIVRDRFHAVVKDCLIPVSVGYIGVIGSMLTAYQEVSLTWHRTDSAKTHHTTFYLVSNLGDTDVLLGNDLSNGLYYSPPFNTH